LLIALLSLLSGTCRALSPDGNIDFHAYWYAGEHLRQGRNPYLAYLNSVYVEPPLTNIDSDELRWTVSYAGNSFTPANTAPLLLLIAPLAYVTWQNAQIIWLLINLLCAIAIPLLAIAVYEQFDQPLADSTYLVRVKPRMLLPEDDYNLAFPQRQELIVAIAILFWATAATRLTLAVGQTSLVVMVLLLGSILGVENAGVGSLTKGQPCRLAKTVWPAMLLGVALSKYSLALPVFLYYIIRRQWKVAFGSILIQLIGLLLLCGLTRSSPVDTVVAYIAIMRIHVGQSGIQLAALLPDNTTWRIVAAVVVTLPVVWAILRRKQTHLSLLSLLSVWTLLVAYHRAYDAVIIIFPCLFLLKQSMRQHSQAEGKLLPAVFAGILCMSLIIGYNPVLTVALFILLGWQAVVPSPMPARVL
jgi:hypothetical protein